MSALFPCSDHYLMCYFSAKMGLDPEEIQASDFSFCKRSKIKGCKTVSL